MAPCLNTLQHCIRMFIADEHEEARRLRKEKCFLQSSMKFPYFIAKKTEELKK